MKSVGTSTPTLVAPLEILQTIIDETRDDLSTLRALSMTCRALAPYAQRHIFAQVDLTPKDLLVPLNMPASLLQFFEVILDKPVIATYVRRFIFNLQADRSTGVHDRQEWRIIIARILISLSNLESLTLSEIHQPVNWDDIGFEVEAALYTVAALPTLHRLSVSMVINIPYAFLATPRRIKVLSLSHCKMSQSVEYAPDIANWKKVHLDTLQYISKAESIDPVSPSEQFSRLFLGHQALFDIRTLERLRVSRVELGPFLQICSRSVKWLGIIPFVLGSDAALDALRWQNLSSLASLELHVLNSHPTLISGFLRRLPSPTRLKFLHVILNLRLGGHSQNSPSATCAQINWLAVTDLDTSASTFPNLERIKFSAYTDKVSSFEAEEAMQEEIRKSLIGRLPLCLQTGKRVNIEVVFR